MRARFGASETSSSCSTLRDLGGIINRIHTAFDFPGGRIRGYDLKLPGCHLGDSLAECLVGSPGIDGAESQVGKPRGKVMMWMVMKYPGWT